MVDRWIVLVISQFVSAAIGFAWGIIRGGWLFIYVGGFFFSLGVFAATMWGFNRWRAKKKLKQRRRH